MTDNDNINTDTDISDSDSDSDSYANIELNKSPNYESIFTNKEICYFKIINKFFITCLEENITKMINIIEENSKISLRVLDWFVTKYSKKRIDCGNVKDTEVFDVRISYKSQLKAYKKKYFDPFRRKKRFNFYYTKDKFIQTTLGQLNFFKWEI